MQDAPVDNVGAPHPLAQCPHAALHLGNHTPGDDTPFNISRHGAGPDHRDQALRVVAVLQDPLHVGQQHQLVGLQGSGNLAGNVVGIDVVGLPILAHSDRRQHRDVAFTPDRFDDLRVNPGDLANETQVHRFPALICRKRQLTGLDQVGVLARKADPPAAQPIDQAHDLLVDPAGQDHLHDLHGLLVGDPLAAYELPVLAQPLQHLLDGRTTAMHNHRVDTDQLEEDAVGDHSLLQFLTDHRPAAVLDDHGLAGELANVGQRLHQDGGFFQRRQDHLRLLPYVGSRIPEVDRCPNAFLR